MNADEVEQTRQRFLALDEDVQDNLYAFLPTLTTLALTSVSRLRLLHEEFPQRAEVITDEETLHAFEATYVRTRMDEEDLKKELDDDLMRLRANLAPYQRIEAEGCEAWSMNIKKPTTAERLMVGVSEAAAATMTALDECRKPACAIKAEGQANFPGEASTEQEGME